MSSTTTASTPNAPATDTASKSKDKSKKLITLKITHQDGFITRRATFRVVSTETAQAVLEKYCKLRNLKAEDYQLVYDDHTLVLDSILFDNQLNSSSRLYQLTLSTNEEVKENCYFPQRLVKNKEDAELAYPVEKKSKKQSSEVKLRVEEKVNQQVIGCDITAKSSTKFERIRTMYCKHRQYKPEDYMFALDGVLIEPVQTLAQIGLAGSDKTFLINVYHKSMVNITH